MSSRNGDREGERWRRSEEPPQRRLRVVWQQRYVKSPEKRVGAQGALDALRTVTGQTVHPEWMCVEGKGVRVHRGCKQGGEGSPTLRSLVLAETLKIVIKGWKRKRARVSACRLSRVTTEENGPSTSPTTQSTSRGRRRAHRKIGGSPDHVQGNAGGMRNARAEGSGRQASPVAHQPRGAGVHREAQGVRSEAPRLCGDRNAPVRHSDRSVGQIPVDEACDDDPGPVVADAASSL